MELNALSPATGSTRAKKRVGRGIGSGSGKTCGTGHKGQKSRSGGSVKPGFEGGQMPLQMRLPKFGFSSRVGRITAEVRTSELNKVDGGLITIESLRKARVITANIKRVKVMLSGEVAKKFTVEGVGVSKGAKEAIEKAGGKVIEVKATESTKKTEPEPEPEAKAKKAAKKVKVAEAKDAAPAGESPADKASDGEDKADKE
jgi:large subunit ribosomal protein L15